MEGAQGQTDEPESAGRYRAVLEVQLLSAEARIIDVGLRVFERCPICEGRGELLKHSIAKKRGMLSPEMVWMRCADCQHVYTQHYHTGWPRDELISETEPEGTFGGNLDMQRWTWNGILNRVLQHIGPPTVAKRLVDVGIGNGGCLFTAAEMGFDAVGIDIRADLLRTPKALGYNVECVDALDYDYTGADVVMLADVLEHVPFPKKLLERIRKHTKGAVFVSCPNMDSVTWKYLDNQGRNPFWVDQEHYHNFTRKSLERLLRQCDFTPVEYAVSSRYQACMEIISV